MGIEVKKNFSIDKIKADLRKSMADTLDSEMQKCAAEIVKRASEGKEIEGGSLASYSAGYKKYKSRIGRNSNVNMTLSGQLLRSIQSKIERAGKDLIGRIFVNPGRQNRFIKPAGYKPRKSGRSASGINNPELLKHLIKLRPFWGLSKEQIKRLTEKLGNIK